MSPKRSFGQVQSTPRPQCQAVPRSIQLPLHAVHGTSECSWSPAENKCAASLPRSNLSGAQPVTFLKPGGLLPWAAGAAASTRHRQGPEADVYASPRGFGGGPFFLFFIIFSGLLQETRNSLGTVPSISILSRDTNLFRKASKTQGKRIRFLKRTMVEKNALENPELVWTGLGATPGCHPLDTSKTQSSPHSF